MKISGNTVLITCGVTGIGLALAEALVGRGNEVIVCGRRRDKPDAARMRLPQLHVRVCDLSRVPARQLARVPFAVTHLDVSRQMCERAAEVLLEIMEE